MRLTPSFIRRAAAFVFATRAFAPVSAITLDEAMDAALAHDSTLADAKSKLTIAKNNLAKSSSLYGSSLAFSGSLSGKQGADGSATPSDIGDARESVAANLSVPLAKWLSIGVTGSTDASMASGSLSLSLIPFAEADTAAETAWNKALIEGQGAVRATILTARKEYRAVLTAQAEVAYRTAAVQTAQNELSRIQYLVELGKERKSGEITAYSELMDAQGDLDTAQSNLTSAIQKISLTTSLSEGELGDFEAFTIAEGRTLVDEERWVASSADMATAKISLESVKAAKKTSASFPDVSVGASVSDSLDWSVTAKVSFSPDVFYQKSVSTAEENLSIQERSYANTERSVRTAWQNQRNALAKAERNHENATLFVESAELSYTETELLLEKGEASRSTLDSANEKLLSARYQLQKALESLENARDELDATWQVNLGRH